MTTSSVDPRSAAARVINAAAAVLSDAPICEPPQPAIVDDPDHPHSRIDQQFLDGVVQLASRLIGKGDIETYELILKRLKARPMKGTNRVRH